MGHGKEAVATSLLATLDNVYIQGKAIIGWDDWSQ